METFKVIRLAKRGGKLPAEFRQEWLERHRDLRRAAKKVVAALSTAHIKDPPYDGMAAIYYSSAAEARAALGDDPSKVEVACDEQLMAQQGDAERLMKTSGQLKLVRTYLRRKDLTLAKFRDYWLKNYSSLHKRLISESPVVRSVASFALPPEAGGNEPAFDGVVELYVSSAEDLSKVISAPVLVQMRKDEENFVQLDAPSAALVAEEYVL